MGLGLGLCTCSASWLPVGFCQEKNQRAAGGRERGEGTHSAYLLVLLVCIPLSTDLHPSRSSSRQYPVFYAMSLIKGPFKHFSTSQPVPLRRKVWAQLRATPSSSFWGQISPASRLCSASCRTDSFFLQLLYPCFLFIFSVLQFMLS